MIPRAFQALPLEALRAAGFAGEVTNGVVCIKSKDRVLTQGHAVSCAMADELLVLAQQRFRQVVLVPQGGGPGTNWQSQSTRLRPSTACEPPFRSRPGRTTRGRAAGAVEGQLNVLLPPGNQE